MQELEASQRATAKVLGVDHATIGRDLNDGANAPSKSKKTDAEADTEAANGANAPSAVTLSGTDAARAVEKKQRDAER